MENLSSLPSADIISIIGIITSTIASIVAIIISVLTLIQNSKMIENSTRPYIAVYGASTHVGTNPHYYLIVKNFGQSAAKINTFVCKPNLAKYSDSSYDNPFYKLSGTTMVPGQSFRCAINIAALQEDVEDLVIDLAYSCGKHTYSEKYQVHISANKGNTVIHEHLPNDLATVSDTLQDLLINSL